MHRCDSDMQLLAFLGCRVDGGGADVAVILEDNLCNMLSTQMSGSHIGLWVRWQRYMERLQGCKSVNRKLPRSGTENSLKHGRLQRFSVYTT